MIISPGHIVKTRQCLINKVEVKCQFKKKLNNIIAVVIFLVLDIFELMHSFLFGRNLLFVDLFEITSVEHFPTFE